MKRRLNILCLLVFLVFCYSVFNMGRDFGHGFSEGISAILNIKIFLYN